MSIYPPSGRATTTAQGGLESPAQNATLDGHALGTLRVHHAAARRAPRSLHGRVLRLGEESKRRETAFFRGAGRRKRRAWSVSWRNFGSNLFRLRGEECGARAARARAYYGTQPCGSAAGVLVFIIMEHAKQNYYALLAKHNGRDTGAEHRARGAREVTLSYLKVQAEHNARGGLGRAGHRLGVRGGWG